jgi:Asp-tRNA(Asn)/Glu-tRNA(Gln) amidotransferase A subunit family amidase
MQGYDALLLPVCAEPAFKHGDGGWDDSFSTNYLRDMRFSQWFNLLCLPAISVPLGRSQEELPIGVQIVAHPFQEPLLFALAELIEKEGAWTHAALA